MYLQDIIQTEVFKVNPWLVYSMDIHRKGVFGAKNIVFDIIDEKSMNMFNTNIFVKIILNDYNVPNIDDSNYFTSLDNIM